MKKSENFPFHKSQSHIYPSLRRNPQKNPKRSEKKLYETTSEPSGVAKKPSQAVLSDVSLVLFEKTHIHISIWKEWMVKLFFGGGRGGILLDIFGDTLLIQTDLWNGQLCEGFFACFCHLVCSSKSYKKGIVNHTFFSNVVYI